ncbi:unnamed protein product [Bursaphelenchus xylophilus]|uniref:(pine wood nematode) hypothetical protein n=1 Tax=Bursaphelenchus xylophilus TaxID=6326 RepID=A0A1I7SWL3_BURXY|nr:unnamed protein product [Bursaphelenchus xylophilus]CAG9099621.1 unnamed protein product [Bursaphelenchus xylophilus]
MLIQYLITLPLLPLILSLNEDRLLDSLHQINQKWDQIFEKTAFLDVLQKGIENEVNGKLTRTNVDFGSYTKQISENLNDFFEKKISSLRKIIKVTEKATTGVDYNQRWIQDEYECYNFMKRINNSDLYFMDVSSQKSGVHVNVESFKCDETVIRDFEWTGKEEIERVLQENLNGDPTIQRQYIGTYSGLTRVYPSFRWESEPSLVTIDLFDPRFRPWFVAAESAPKDILFLLDYSGSVKGQTLHLNKMIIMYILTTLTPNDYFNAVWYNSKREMLLSSCSGDSFIPATTRNKRIFQHMLDKIEEKDQATLPPAVNMSLNQFVSESYRKAYKKRQTSGGHKAIMLFTDGVEFWPIQEIKSFRKNYPKEKVRIFGYSMGYGTGHIPALDWISCETDGTYSIVDSISDVRMQSRAYLTKLVKPLADELGTISPEDRPPVFSYPYMDTQGEGGVISISSPVLNFMDNVTAETNSLLGVASIDITLESLRLLAKGNEGMYAFIIDNNGIVFYHPKLKLPPREVYSVRRTACHNVKGNIRHGTRVQYGPADERVKKIMGLIDSIFTLDVLELETDHTERFKKFRDKMIKGDCNEVVDDGNKQYKCAKIKDTPLTIGFVWNKKTSIVDLDEESKEILFEENDLVADWVRQPSLCSEFLSVNPLFSQYESLMDLAEKEAECMSLRDRKLLSTFHRGVSEWRQQWPYLDLNQTCEVHTSITDEARHPHFHSAFVETLPGVVTFYPACHNKSIQHFYEDQPQLLSRPTDTTSTKVRMDPFSQLVTTYREITDKDTQSVIAVIGAQWDKTIFSELFNDALENDDGLADCRNNGVKCILVTNDLFILGSKLPLNNIHLSTTEPELLHHLIGQKVVEIGRRQDYQAECGISDRRYDKVRGNTSLSFRPLTIFSNLINILISLIYSFISVESKPYYQNQTCHFQRRDFIEQCVVEENYFTLKSMQKVTVRYKVKKNCYHTGTILPSPDKRLNLIVIEGFCESDPSLAKKLSIQYEYRPYRVDDCTLSNLTYRARPTIIFNEKNEVPHPDKCSDTAGLKISILLMIAAVLIVH